MEGILLLKGRSEKSRLSSLCRWICKDLIVHLSVHNLRKMLFSFMSAVNPIGRRNILNVLWVPLQRAVMLSILYIEPDQVKYICSNLSTGSDSNYGNVSHCTGRDPLHCQICLNCTFRYHVPYCPVMPEVSSTAVDIVSKSTRRPS